MHVMRLLDWKYYVGILFSSVTVWLNITLVPAVLAAGAAELVPKNCSSLAENNQKFTGNNTVPWKQVQCPQMQ